MWKKAEKRSGGNVVTEGRLAFQNSIPTEENPYGGLESRSAWLLGWQQAQASLQQFVAKQAYPARDSGPSYSTGFVITALIPFIGSWIYCIATYGFLFGVGLGWLPSLIVAVIAGALWPLTIVAVAILLLRH